METRLDLKTLTKARKKTTKMQELGGVETEKMQELGGVETEKTHLIIADD